MAILKVARLGHPLLRQPGQQHAPAHAPQAPHHAGAHQGGYQALQVSQRYLLAPCDIPQRHRPFAVVHGDVQQHPRPVASPAR